MRILQINKFLYPKGGDAISMLNTGRLLASRGHTVHYWGMRHPANPEYPHSDLFVGQVDYHKRPSLRQAVRQSLQILYSFEAKAKVERMLRETKPDIVHLHNFAHQISPSVLHAFRKLHVPVVMTMHDFKLVCPVYTLLANGRFCSQCRNGRFYWCCLKKCVKGSYAKSMLGTLEMVLHHQVLHIYDLIDLYFSPSRFMEQTVRAMGLAGEIRYLPNFIDLQLYPPLPASPERSFVYFGRLDEGKGLENLLAAAAGIKSTLKIIGEGPLRGELERRSGAQTGCRIRFLGYLQGADLRQEIQASLAVIQPSELNENNPLSVLEAFALGKPVIGSNLGGIPELVRNGETGLTFEAGNAEHLRERMSWMLEHPEQAADLGRAARQMVGREFNAERHYASLTGFYQQAIARHD